MWPSPRMWQSPRIGIALPEIPVLLGLKIALKMDWVVGRLASGHYHPLLVDWHPYPLPHAGTEAMWITSHSTDNVFAAF